MGVTPPSGSSIGTWASSSGVEMACLWKMWRRSFNVSMKPPVPGEDASRNVSGDTSSALPVVLITWLSVTPASLSRCGSTSTCSCRSRNPHVETLATPSTPSSRGTMTQRARSDVSMGESSSDESFTIPTRLVDDNGWII